MTIRIRIILLGTLSILSLLYIVGAVSWVEYRNLLDKTVLLEQVNSEVRYSNVIHELQRERGLSVGAVARPSETNRQALATQQTSTDSAISQLMHSEIEGLDGLARLKQMRELTSSPLSSANVFFNYYTNTISDILDRIVELSKNSDAEIVKRNLYAHAHLMYAKEHLGGIRALLNEGLSARRIDMALRADISRHLGRYHYHIRIFLNDSSPEIANSFDLEARLSGMSRTYETINVVLSSQPGTCVSLTAGQWFKMATTSIDILKDVEDKSANEVQWLITSEIDVAKRRLLAYIVVSLIISVTLIYLATSAILRLLRALDIVLNGVYAVVRSNNFTHRIKLDTNDEMGTVARGFNELLDIAERLIKEQIFLASSDPLTGAFNRYKFVEIFNQEVLRTQRYNSGLSLIMFDIDHFKIINDQYGHLAGDSTLKEIVAIVRQSIRATDFLIRWGGEEFVILIPEQHLSDAKALAEKLRGIVESHPFPNIPTSVTASFGVAEYVAGDTLEVLCAHVDCALYQAKHGGRNRVCVESRANHTQPSG